MLAAGVVVDDEELLLSLDLVELLSEDVDVLDELSELLEVLSAGFLSLELPADFLPESRLSLR